MVKISSKSSIKSKRIHSSYIQRNRVIRGSSSTVDPVDPVTPVINDISYSSANHLMSSDAFYDKLEELTKEYLNFYHQERNLKKAIDAIEENMDVDLIYIIDLVDKYNNTSKALKNFDKQIHTNHSENIKNILYEYESDLNNMGIFIIENNQLVVDEDLFKINLIKSKDNFNDEFKPMRRMILKLYKNFRNIKGPDREILDSKYDDFPNRDFSGIIMDKES